jgi:hypothetical protein
MKCQQVTGDNEFISPFPIPCVQIDIILPPDFLNARCALVTQNLDLENLIAMKEQQLAFAQRTFDRTRAEEKDKWEKRCDELREEIFLLMTEVVEPNFRYNQT